MIIWQKENQYDIFEQDDRQISDQWAEMIKSPANLPFGRGLGKEYYGQLEK